MKRLLFFFVFFAAALGVFHIAYAQLTPPILQTTTPGLCGGSGWFYYSTCPNYAAANNYITCNSQQKFSGGTWTHGNCYDSDESSGWTFSGGNCVTDNFCVEPPAPPACSANFGNACQVCNNVGSCNYGTISCSETCVDPQGNLVISPFPNVYDTTPPTGSLTAYPSAIYSGDTVTLYLQGQDETGILYLSWTDNSGTHWQNCNGAKICAASGPLTLWVPKTDYIFLGTIVDMGGNIVFVTSNKVAVTDNVAPTGSISVSPNPVAPGQNFTVTMTGQDAGGLFSLAWVDNGISHEVSSSQLFCPSGTVLNAPCNATWGGIKFSSGNYTIGGVVTDIAGNKTNVYTALTVADTIPPWGAIAAWPSQINVGGSVNLYLQGYDNGAVSLLTWIMKDSSGSVVRSGSKTCGQPTVPLSSCDWTTFATIFTSDTYSFSGSITDLAGNTTPIANPYGQIKVGSGVAACQKTTIPISEPTLTLLNNCHVSITHLGKDYTDLSDVSYEPYKALTASNTNYIAMSDNPPLSCSNDLVFHNTWDAIANPGSSSNFAIGSQVDSASAGNALGYGFEVSSDNCVIQNKGGCSSSYCPLPAITSDQKSFTALGRMDWSGASTISFGYNLNIVPDVPSIAFNTPQNQWYSSTPLLTIAFSDAISSLDSAHYQIDSIVSTLPSISIFGSSNNAGQSTSSSVSISEATWDAFSQGPHTIYVSAYNKAGFCAGCDGTTSISINKDTIAPTSSIDEFAASKDTGAPNQQGPGIRISDNTYWFGAGTWNIPVSDNDPTAAFGTGSGLDPNGCWYRIIDSVAGRDTGTMIRSNCNSTIPLKIGPVADPANNCVTQGFERCRVEVSSIDRAGTRTIIYQLLNIDYTPPTAQ